jgi:hypothetical protein
MNTSEQPTPDIHRRPFPSLSILSILAAPLLGFVSLPFWAWMIDNQMQKESFEGFYDDANQFRAVGVAAGVICTAMVGATFGLVITWLANRRNERCKPLRTISWVINGLITLLAIFLLIYNALT